MARLLLVGSYPPWGLLDSLIVIMTLMVLLSTYALYRMTQRPTVAVEETGSFTAVAPNASPIAVEIAQEYAKDLAIEEENAEAVDKT